MTTKALLITAVLLALLTGLAAILAKKKGKTATGELRAKHPLSEREQSMFFRLTGTFPEHVVLAQVAFSAMLETKDRATRSTFDRKVADFVLCSKDFKPLAVIELDDASHRGRERSDEARAAKLKAAGYRVIRFKNIPDTEELKRAVATTTD